MVNSFYKETEVYRTSRLLIKQWMNIKKYKARTLSTVEEDYLNSIKILEKKQKKNSESISGISGLAFPVYYEGFEGEVIRLLNENTVETVYLLSFSIEKCFTHQKKVPAPYRVETFF